MSAAEEPLVSVIMGVYNAEKYLAPAIESILGQTYRNWEFIIVDDGSTDFTTKILKDFEAKDPRIKIILQANQGLTKSLNTAASVAQGVYLARMDADDIAMPERFEKQVAFLQKNMDVDLLGTAIMIIDDAGKKKRFYTYPLQNDHIKKRLNLAAAFAHPTIMVRCIPFMAVGGYRSAFRYAQDYDLYLRLQNKIRFANLAEPLLLHRIHNERISDEKTAEQVLCSVMARYDSRVGGGAVHEEEDLSKFDIEPFKFGTEEQRGAWFFYKLMLAYRTKCSDFYDLWQGCDVPEIKLFLAPKILMFLAREKKYKELKEFAKVLWNIVKDKYDDHNSKPR